MESLAPHRAYPEHPAWQQAWRLRCCPPDHMLVKPADDRLRDHLALCPWCREALDLPECPIPELDVLEPQPPPLLLPGQLYTLHPKLAGWGPKARYYNPPIVLILSCPDAQSVFVSQTYGDFDLAGPDDVLLDTGFQGFAQPWNCYTLLQDDVCLYLGRVDVSIVETIQQRLEQEHFSPKPGSLLWFFRQMEVETGYFFSSRAVSQLMEHHEHDLAVPFAGTDSQAILRDLQRLPLRFGAIIPSTHSPLELLCWAEPDPQRLPLAAADDETTLALSFTAEHGCLTGVELLPLTLSSRDYANGLLTVTGSAASLPAGKLTWLLRWQAGSELIEPLPENSGHDGDFFWATFSLTPQQTLPPARLIVRLLREYQG